LEAAEEFQSYIYSVLRTSEIWQSSIKNIYRYAPLNSDYPFITINCTSVTKSAVNYLDRYEINFEINIFAKNSLAELSNQMRQFITQELAANSIRLNLADVIALYNYSYEHQKASDNSTNKLIYSFKAILQSKII